MGVANPAETIVGILSLLDEVRTKMDGTRLAAFPWRPTGPQAAEKLTDLLHDVLSRCDDLTEAVIAVTVAAMAIAHRTPD
jgi:hypothetical protein